VLLRLAAVCQIHHGQLALPRMLEMAAPAMSATVILGGMRFSARQLFVRSIMSGWPYRRCWKM
jgi:hypothetical protein